MADNKSPVTREEYNALMKKLDDMKQDTYNKNREIYRQGTESGQIYGFKKSSQLPIMSEERYREAVQRLEDSNQEKLSQIPKFDVLDKQIVYNPDTMFALANGYEGACKWRKTDEGYELIIGDDFLKITTGMPLTGLPINVYVLPSIETTDNWKLKQVRADEAFMFDNLPSDVKLAQQITNTVFNLRKILGHL